MRSPFPGGWRPSLPGEGGRPPPPDPPFPVGLRPPGLRDSILRKAPFRKKSRRPEAAGQPGTGGSGGAESPVKGDLVIRALFDYYRWSVARQWSKLV